MRTPKKRHVVGALILSSMALSLIGCNLKPETTIDPSARMDGGTRSASKKQPDLMAVDYKKELVITDLSVVNDPVRTKGMGPWTFGALMTKMAGKQDPELFVRHWIDRWMVDEVVSGETIAKRQTIKQLILDPWPRIPGTDKLDLSKAPFRLLAITNRIDLRRVGNAGEGRFVFCVVDRNGRGSLFNTIFEYGIPLHVALGEKYDDDEDELRPYERMMAVQEWGKKWHKLSSMPYGPAFNAELQRITDAFSGANADPRKPNGSSLNQLRTNEIELGILNAIGPGGFDPTKALPWELREFHIGDNGLLNSAPVALTPPVSKNNTQELADYINQNEAAILQEQHVLPAALQGGVAPVPGAFGEPAIFWNGPGIKNAEARFKFSLNTCNGCHFAESGLNQNMTPGIAFLQVRPRAANQEAGLSTFMTGGSVIDPTNSNVTRQVNDLQRRVDDLKTVLSFRKDTAVSRRMEEPFPARVH